MKSYSLHNARRFPAELRRAALSRTESQGTLQNSHSKHSISPKKILNRVFHPHGNGGNAPEDKQQAKRIRAGDEDVIVIDSDSDTAGPSRRPSNTAEEINLTKVLPAFRVGVSSLA